MKKLMTGLAVAASAAAIANPEAQSQTPAECQPTFYDETDRAPESRDLQQVIGQFAAKDVTVKVRILKDANSRGIKNADDAAEFQNNTIEACDLEDEHTLSVYVSDEPRLYNTFTTVAKDETGKSKDRLLTTDEVMDVSDDFQDDLRDSDTPYQEDVTNHLERLLPKASVDTPRAESSSDGPDIPWGSIAIGSGVFILLSGTAGRIKRASTLKRGYRAYKTSADEAHSRLVNVQGFAEHAVSTVPEGDKKITQELEQISNNLGSLSRQSDTIAAIYKRRRFHIWPQRFYPYDNVSAARSNRHYDPYFDSYYRPTDTEKNLVNAVNTARVNATSLKRETVRFNETKDKLPSQYSALQAALSEYDLLIEEMESEGWDVSADKSLAEQTTALSSTIAKSIQAGNVNSPSEVTKIALRDTRANYDALSELPDKRRSLDEDVRNYSLTDTQEEVDKIRHILAQLQSTYHPSCMREFSNTNKDVRTLRDNITETLSQAQHEAGVKTPDSVKKTDSLLERLYQERDKLEKTYTDLVAHQTRLEELKASLPTTIQALGEASGDIHTFVFETYVDYMNNDIREAANALQVDMKKLSEIDLTADKPAYLDIEMLTTELTERTRTLAEQARKLLPKPTRKTLRNMANRPTEAPYNLANDPLLIYAVLIGTLNADTSRNTESFSSGGGGYSGGGGHHSPSGGGGGGGNYTPPPPAITSGGGGDVSVGGGF